MSCLTASPCARSTRIVCIFKEAVHTGTFSMHTHLAARTHQHAHTPHSQTSTCTHINKTCHLSTSKFFLGREQVCPNSFRKSRRSRQTRFRSGPSRVIIAEILNEAGMHEWMIASLLVEMKDLKGAASFELCETEFGYSRR